MWVGRVILFFFYVVNWDLAWIDRVPCNSAVLTRIRPWLSKVSSPRLFFPPWLCLLGLIWLKGLIASTWMWILFRFCLYLPKVHFLLDIASWQKTSPVKGALLPPKAGERRLETFGSSLTYKVCLCGQNVLWGPSPIHMSYEQPLCTLFSKEYSFFHHEDLASWEGFHNSKYCTRLSFNHSIAFRNLSWLF